VMSLCVINFAACMNYLKINFLLWRKCSIEGGETWKWRRRLWAWEEEMVVECMNLLLIVMLQVDTDDRWSGFMMHSMGTQLVGPISCSEL
jgi:hypothetical protein